VRGLVGLACFADLEDQGDLPRVVEEHNLTAAVDDLVRHGQIVLGEQPAETLLGVCMGPSPHGRILSAHALRVCRGLRRFSGGADAA
jgi:hypothetical protein